MSSKPVNKNLRALWANHMGKALPYVVLEGGSRSGKTFSTMEYLLTVGLGTKNLRIGVFRFDQATCRDGVITDALKIMENKTVDAPNGDKILIGNYWRFIKSELRMVCESTGSEIKFLGTSDAGKLHGPQWDFIFLNEVMEITWESYSQLQQRTSQLIIMDFNPSLSQHWVFEKILPKGKHEVLHVHSTFKDNPYLEQRQIDRIKGYEPTEENRTKGTADAWRWDVYGLGKRGKIEGAVYSNWSIRYDGWPSDQWEFKAFGYATDYGYSVDPTVLLSIGLHNNNIYVRQYCYETGLLIVRNPVQPSLASLQERMEQVPVYKQDPVIAESANPESNAQLAACGYNIIPAKKGPNSILEGIGIVRSHHVFVHPESIDVVREFEQYRFLEDKSGHYRSLPQDKHNHAMDPLRYWAAYNLGQGRAIEARANSRPRPSVGNSTKRRVW